ncbi:hypothetical protein EAE96_011316 [Botrytis aclada]|nr:hypothetical protein EAE96_011316 [Botrytis aclada]
MSDPNPSNGATVASLPPAAIALATRMYDAARNGDIEIFEQALSLGLPANMTNEKGDSLIMLAAYHGHAPLVRVLLQHGANPNSLNDRGQSPLAGAVFKGESEVIEALLEGNADPEHGAPSAMRAVELFKQEEQWLKKFEEAPGRGKAL